MPFAGSAAEPPFSALTPAASRRLQIASCGCALRRGSRRAALPLACEGTRRLSERTLCRRCGAPRTNAKTAETFRYPLTTVPHRGPGTAFRLFHRVFRIRVESGHLAGQTAAADLRNRRFSQCRPAAYVNRRCRGAVLPVRTCEPPGPRCGPAGTHVRTAGSAVRSCRYPHANREFRSAPVGSHARTPGFGMREPAVLTCEHGSCRRSAHRDLLSESFTCQKVERTLHRSLRDGPHRQQQQAHRKTRGMRNVRFEARFTRTHQRQAGTATQVAWAA